MSDILSIRVGEVWRGAGMVARADGSAITTGTVTHYLKALTGDNAGKWWKDDDQTWAETETGTEMTHQADGRWTVQLAASPFGAGVIYLEYAKESGDLHVPGEGRMLRGVNAIVVDSAGKVAVPDTQKVDIDTIKTRAVGDVGAGNAAHLLQSADAGATAVSRFDAATDEVTTDEASRNASKATGFSTHNAADVVTALGTGSTLTACLTATGFLTTLGTTAPAGWIDAAAVAAGAVTKIQDGLATPTNITAGTITTVTTLTNLPAVPANWLTAAGIAAGALNGKGDWSTVVPDAAGTANTLITALESHGDANWGGGLDAAGVRAAIGMAAANLDTQIAALVPGTPINITSKGENITVC